TRGSLSVCDPGSAIMNQLIVCFWPQAAVPECLLSRQARRPTRAVASPDDAQAGQIRPMLTRINAADEATKPRLSEVYCMNHPWLTTTDWPVSAFDGNAARNTATSATSCAVVNSPSTVSFNITVLTTSASEIPSSRACSGICFSTSGVRT